MNIINNAIDAMDGEGTLVVRACWEDPWVVVEIEDDGPGIPEEFNQRYLIHISQPRDPATARGWGWA